MHQCYIGAPSQQGVYSVRGLLGPVGGQERNQPTVLQLHLWAGRTAGMLHGEVLQHLAVMGAVQPSTRYLVEAAGTEELVVHRKSIDGMAATGVAFALIVGKVLMGLSKSNSARNMPRWPLDRETHRFAMGVKQISKLAIVAKRRTQRTVRQGCLDLSSAEEDEGVELSHLLFFET